MELFLDRSNPLHWTVALVLFASSVACGWIGVRDGFVRRHMATNTGLLTGGRAMAAGALYVATALVGLWGTAAFLMRGR
jgi:hypothetical protein